ncbi:MAG: glycerophosphodiester phosphodiesterase [Bacteroidia bacterium]|nr:glycerophosphodiester phosphodiesterase [Bacteroidia bacterium]NND52604.1 glycerophosphodiester phosphodiesterase [Flavobacteriaceae bacterium]
MTAIHGHRGCRGLFPENSLPAFEKAIELGVDALEMDLAISKDRKVVVSHEPFMSRRICLDPFGNEIPEADDLKHNLFEMSYAEIKAFDCGLKYHPDYPGQKKIKAYKPLLEEAIEQSKKLNPDIDFNLEIKAKPKYDQKFTPEPDEFVNLVLGVLRKTNSIKNTNLQSFDLRILEQIKRQCPEMKVALLIDRKDSIFEKLKQLNYKPEIISPYFKLLNEQIVRSLKGDGFKIIPWTVNEDEDLQRMIAFQVDGIITDFPNKLTN